MNIQKHLAWSNMFFSTLLEFESVNIQKYFVVQGRDNFVPLFGRCVRELIGRDKRQVHKGDRLE